MAASTQTAIRVGDDITHSEALFGGIEGMLLGAAAGLLIGALVVSTGGLAGVVLIAGWGLLGAGLGGSLGKIIGSHHSAGAKGKVLTGSPNVFIGTDKMPAARAEADVAHCEDHSDSETGMDQPAVLGHRIAQGSEHVLINGHYAARHGDKGTCDFALGDGWPTVVIGGPPKTVAGMKITSETASIDGLILGMTIVGGIILAAPAAIGIITEGLAAEIGWGAIGGQLFDALVVPLARGMVMAKVVGQDLKYIGGKIWGEGSEGQDVSEFFGELVGGFGGGMGEAGAGEAGAGEAGAGEAGAGEAGAGEAGAGEAGAGEAGAGEAGAGEAGAGEAGAGEAGAGGDPEAASGTRRYGGTGAQPDYTSTPEAQAKAGAAYDQIRANPDDVAQIAKNTGYPEDVVARAKDHLFNSQHDIFDPQTGETARGNFTPNQDFADMWNKAADGTLGKGANPWDPENPMETNSFRDLIRHEYVESHLTGDGIPYQSPEGWTPDESGGWRYDGTPENYGAHDLSPRSGSDPFGHYPKTVGLDPEGIPRPNEDLSNLDDVVAGIRRTLGGEGDPEGGSSGGSGPAGPEGGPGTGGPTGRGPPAGRGPAGAGEEPSASARPLPANPPEGRPVTPAPEAQPPAAPDAAPGGRSGTAPEPTAPLPENAPEAARTAPEPVPDAAAPSPAIVNPNGRPFAQRTSLEPLPENPTLRRQMLSQETAQTRANSGVARSIKNGKENGGCVGVARTDIPGLQDRVFEGGSRYAGDTPDNTFIHGDGSINRAQSHAEQNLAGEFDRAVKSGMDAGSLTPTDLVGRNVYMHTELPTCASCKWGINTPGVSPAKLGVPMKLSQAYPDTTFTYTSDAAPSEVLVIKNGVATKP